MLKVSRGSHEGCSVFFFDESGEPKAVLIDVKKNPDLWEDFRDYLIIRERSHEPAIPFDKAMKRLKRLGKIK